MTKTKSKVRTNDVAFKELFKGLNSVQIALLRERVLFICEETAKQCVNWENSFVNPSMYIDLNESVKKHLGFDDNK